MTASYTYDGGALVTVRRNTVEMTQTAKDGGVGSGRLTINDAAGTLAIIGQMDFAADETACADTLTARGFIAARDWYRGPNAEGAARDIDVEFVDLNAMAGFRLIGADGNRPSESVATRGAWIMGSAYVTGLFTAGTRVDFASDVTMDKSDYRNQYPGDVLADMAMAQGNINRYIRDFGSGPELVFRNDNTSTDDTSDVRISDVIADVTGDLTGLTFYPSKDFRLHRSPDQVYSKLAYSYGQGTVVEERAATATAFNGERGGTASNSNVKTAARATAQAQDMLLQHSTEEDTLEGSILVPATAANLLNHGDRLQVRFTHMGNTGGRDYDEFAWCRVLEETKKPLLKAADKYELRLRLSPQETPPEPDICNDLWSPTASDTYYPLGGDNGSGAHPFASDGVVHYWRGGYGIPNVPDLHEIGSWHFGVWGAGGPSTTDWAGDCTGNALILITVGNGTWTIQTEMYGGSPRALEARLGTEYSYASLYSYLNSGDPVTVTIADATDGDCVRSTVVKDRGLACGGKWGFSQAVWVAA